LSTYGPKTPGIACWSDFPQADEWRNGGADGEEEERVVLRPSRGL